MAGAPRRRGSERADVSLRDGARAPAQAARRRSRDRSDPAEPRLGWARRAGFVLALSALGAGIVLAGNGVLDRGAEPTGGTSPSPPLSSPAGPRTPPPPGTLAPPELRPEPPRLVAPDGTVTTSRRAVIEMRIPRELLGSDEHRLRVYVNDELQKERRMPIRARVRVRGLQLRSGGNTITAAIAGPAGESERSEPVELSLDDQPPAIDLDRPVSGAVLDRETVEIVGRTEPGAALLATNATNGDSVAVDVDADGSFRATLRLEEDENALVIQATDPNGNTARRQLSVTRGEPPRRLILTMADSTFRRRELPVTLSVRLQVKDQAGRHVDGAAVIFSISPPGLPTSTYRTTTTNGYASWSALDLPRDGTAAGEGLVTAFVTLPGGETLRESIDFTVR